MGVQTGFWRIQQDRPVRIQSTAIDYEKRLETLIETDCSIIAEPRRWLVIGRQVPTVHGGFIDLLAMDETGALIVVELKRDRTDREVVSQALDYASWVQDLQYEDVATVFEDYQRRRGNKAVSLQDAF
ncbi:MAG: endonuclease NucS [Anaerosomatales bacterium]|nr:endonuclease NucS [Anaerosomatales bacterium]